MFMALAKPVNTSKKHGRVLPLGQGGRSCRRLSRLPSSPPPPLLLVPSSPSWTLVVPFLLPMWTVCASDCFESDHFQAGRREQTPSEEVIYPTKREACQLLASPLDPFCPPCLEWAACCNTTAYSALCELGGRWTLMCNISLLSGW